MNKQRKDLKAEFKRLFSSMDFLAKHPALERSGPEGERMAELYQQLGGLWEFLALQCPHREGWRKTREGRMVCKVCGSFRDGNERWVLLPREGGKRVGRRSTPTSKKTFPNKKKASVIEDSIRFHGAKVTVDVHNAYRSNLFPKSKLDIAIAAERIVQVEEGGMECSFDESQVCLHLKKHKRGEKPPSGAFVGELPKHLLKKLPLLIEFDENDEMVGISVFRTSRIQRSDSSD